MLLLLIFILLILITTWFLSSPFYWRKKGIKYMIPYPIFGSMFSTTYKGLAQTTKEIYNKFPDEKLIGFHFFTRPTLYVKDPEMIEDMLVKNFDHFSSRGIYCNPDYDPFGSNIFFKHGEEWKYIKKKLSIYFTPSRVKAMVQNLDSTLPKAFQVIDKNINEGKCLEIGRLITDITNDLILQGLFSIESDVFEKDSVFRKVESKMFLSNFIFCTFMGIISPRLNDMLRLRYFKDEVNKFITNFVIKLINYRKINNTNSPDFLQGMIELMKENENTKEVKYFSDETRIPNFDLRTVVSHVLVLYGGGIDSAAITMSYFFYEIARDQELQQRCRNEIDEVVAETGVPIRAVDTSKLPFLSMVLKETMRKHAIFSVLTRSCTKAYQIPGTDVTLEPGAFVIVPIEPMHEDPKYFPEPDKFIPERFSKEEEEKRKPGCYLPWGFGHKTCLGKTYAWSEMKVICARLLQNYRFILSDRTKVPVKKSKYKPMISPEQGVWVIAQHVHQNN